MLDLTVACSHYGPFENALRGHNIVKHRHSAPIRIAEPVSPICHKRCSAISDARAHVKRNICETSKASNARSVFCQVARSMQSFALPPGLETEAVAPAVGRGNDVLELRNSDGTKNRISEQRERRQRQRYVCRRGHRNCDETPCLANLEATCSEVRLRDQELGYMVYNSFLPPPERGNSYSDSSDVLRGFQGPQALGTHRRTVCHTLATLQDQDPS